MLKYLALLACVFAACPILLAQDAKKSWDKPPEMKIDPNKTYTATINTTKGKIVVEFGSPEDLDRIVSEIVGSGPGRAPAARRRRPGSWCRGAPQKPPRRGPRPRPAGARRA